MNTVDEYDIQIQDYCRMNLYLVEKVLKMKIPLKAIEKNTKDFLDPLYNHDKIFDRPIMNTKVDMEENVDVNHRVRH